MGQARTINIPDHHLNRLAQHLINVIPEYLKNPANQSRFEEWEIQNKGSENKCSKLKQK